ncbi:hypothetical protein PRZ48_014537 [Zasmidium cellare]|uniref:GA4 desaturase family protein n=1 Tax=Zasmidium cellare TaxID=395010 RepID=A0ABR0DYK2_ZASCE|nr:hypothetical protein PRZ48_014537 [Zasmidium cellare]
MGQVLPPNTLHTTLNYYLTPDKGGDKIFYPGTAGNYRRKHEPHDVNIFDLRESSEKVEVDKQGFQLVQHSALDNDLTDPDFVKTKVYDDTAELLKKATGASRVHVFSHIIRKQTWASAVEAGKHLPDKQTQSSMSSAMFIHVDQSYEGAAEVFRDNLPAEDAARLSKSRWAIINVWRPIQQTIRREQLAFCDARTVPEEDLYPVRAQLPAKGSGTYEDVSKGGTFETWHLLANPSHKWFYCSELKPDESLLIKCYDSKKDGRARLTPHTAFSSDRDSGPPRQSVEVRSLVFWEDQSLE